MEKTQFELTRDWGPKDTPSTHTQRECGPGSVGSRIENRSHMAIPHIELSIAAELGVSSYFSALGVRAPVNNILLLGVEAYHQNSRPR